MTTQTTPQSDMPTLPEQHLRRRVRAAWVAGLTLALLAAAVLPAAGESVPPAINYQGKLTDNLGNAIKSGYYEIQFRIWNDPIKAETANYIWGRTFPLHVVTNGMFNVLLSNDGEVPGAPSVNSILDAFKEPDRYLGLTVVRNPDGAVSSPVEITPRQKLATAPFAVHAHEATSAGHATTADNATQAVNASSAVTADNATKFDNMSTSDFLKVKQTSQTLTGNLTITNGQLTVYGNTTVSAGTFRAQGASVLDGTLTVNGVATFNNTSKFTGAVTLDTLNAGTSGAVTVKGNVSLLKKGSPGLQGEIHSTTDVVPITTRDCDGFLIVYGYKCDAKVWLDFNGDNWGELYPSLFFTESNADTELFTMPIPKGGQAEVQATYVASNGYMKVWWMKMGN